MLSDLQLLAMTVAIGVFFCGLLSLARWQEKEERKEAEQQKVRLR